MTLKELWKAALGEIKLDISQANFLTWFKDTFIVDKKDTTVYLGVPSNFTKEWLENKYNKYILEALNHLDNNIRRIKYVVATNTKEVEKIQKAKTTARRKPKNKNIITEDQLNFPEFSVDSTTNLNPKYTFDTFIVGAHNELAQAAALAVTKSPGTRYNPLFIYGGVGLGKTHLLQAIGNKLKKSKKHLKIKYVPSERFTNDLVNAIAGQKMDEFKKKFRNLDVLLIDDIQFIAGKDKTQEELFHTFNTLYEKNKQIVFTSDRPPKAIPSIEERLRSRFEGGMIADIEAPDFETRLAILREKNKKYSNLVSEDILRYIAEEFPHNVRELEGALNRVVARSRLENKEMSLGEVKEILSSIISSARQYIPIKKVIKKVASFYDLTEENILSHSRKKEFVKPRQITMYILRNELKYSYSNIAEKLGHRDHTTVIHACKKIEEEVKKNPVFSQEITILKDALYNK